MNWFERLLLRSGPVRVSEIRGYTVKYMPASVMDKNSSFGYNINQEVYVKEGLAKRVEKFVISHEIYHIQDKQSWLGWLGRELRANAVCGLKDPLGFLSTIGSSFNKKRIRAYMQALKEVNIH